MDHQIWIDERVRELMDEEPELAWLVWRLPTLVAERQHTQVEAAAEEAIGRARAWKDVWLEVLVRLWRLQDRLDGRWAAREALPEAQDLHARAQAPDAAACPHAPLAAALLCRAQALVDGPGFAALRLAQAEGALAALEPGSPAWGALQAERAAALTDLGQGEGALAALQGSGGSRVREERVRALLSLGHATEALAHTAPPEGADEQARLSAAVDRALVLARLGRTDEALAALPPVETLPGRPGIWLRTGEAVRLLLAAGRLAWDMGTFDLLLGLARDLRDRGAARAALELGWALAGLSLAHEAGFLGECALDVVSPALAELRDPEPARATHAALRARLAQARPPLPPSAQALRERVQSGGVSASVLVLAAATWPEEPDLVQTAASFLGQRRLHAHAVALLEQAALAAPRSVELAGSLAGACLEAQDRARLDRLLPLWAQLGGEHAVLAAWTEARWRLAHPEAGSAVEPLRRAVALAPSRAPLRARLAAALVAEGALEPALEQLLAAQSLPGADPELAWDVCRVATRLGRWDLVRACAAALGLPVPPGEGPIDERWGLCQLQYPDGTEPVYAVRTGPVTARVLQLSPPDQPSRFEDRVVFNPAPLERPQAGASAPSHWTYPVDAVLHPGGWHSWAIDGVHPGTEAWEDLCWRLEGEGYKAQVISPPTYRLRHPWSGDELPGVLALVGVPPSRSPAALAELLVQLLGDQDPPLTFPALLLAVGQRELAAEQARLQRQWGI